MTVLEKEQKLTYIAFLAWASLSRQKLTALNFEEFIETVASVGASEADPK